MNEFTVRAISIISRIPEGKVMYYGQIARLSGNPRAARQVVRILHSMSEKYCLPWHRVINSKGEIAFNSDDSISNQKERLENEGVKLNPYNKIDMGKYLFHPDIDCEMNY